jgi:hypothetical protein
LEVIETLKESVKKSDTKSKNNILSTDIKPKFIIDDIKNDDKFINELNNNNKYNQMILNDNHYMNTETNQTYDNQVLFTEKNNQKEKDLSSKNLFTVRKDFAQNNNNNNSKNKNIFQNLTTENGRKFNFFYYF